MHATIDRKRTQEVYPPTAGEVLSLCLRVCYVTPSQVLSLSHFINRKNIFMPFNMSPTVMERERFVWFHPTGALALSISFHPM